MSGRIVVTIKTDPATGVQRGYDNLGNLVGTYDPRTNLTYNKGGKQVSKGNGLVGVATNSLCPKGMGAVCHPVAVIQSSYHPRNVSRPFSWILRWSPRKPYRPIPMVTASSHLPPFRPVPPPSSYTPSWPWRPW